MESKEYDDWTTLRPYQRKAVNNTKEAWLKGHNNNLTVMPTGTGKGVLAGQIIAEEVAQGKRILFVAHRGELLAQEQKVLQDHWPEVVEKSGIIQGGKDVWDKQVTFASVQSLMRSDARRLKKAMSAGPYSLLIIDEAHHSVSPTYIDLIQQVSTHTVGTTCQCLRMLGLTATPERGDGKQLGDIWALTGHYTYEEAIHNGHIVPPFFEVAEVPGLREKLGEVKLTTGEGGYSDYESASLAEVVLRTAIVTHTAKLIKEKASTRKGIVYTTSVLQAASTAEAINSHGIPAALLTGRTPEKEREQILADLREGKKLRFVVNCGVLTEGYDDTSIDCIVLARPTRSKTLFLQTIGRGLRKHPDKTDCLVLDLVAASQEHQLMSAGVVLRTVFGSAPNEEGQDPKPRTPFDSWDKTRNRTLFNWINVKEVLRRETLWPGQTDAPDYDVWCLPVGRQGTVAVLGLGGDPSGAEWLAVYIPKSRDEPFQYPVHRLVTLSTALGYSEDVVRRAEKIYAVDGPGVSDLAYSKRGWRGNPTSPASAALAMRYGVPLGKNQGETTDRLTAFFAARNLYPWWLRMKGEQDIPDWDRAPLVW